MKLQHNKLRPVTFYNHLQKHILPDKHQYANSNI